MSDVEVTLSEYTVEITISGSDSTEIVVSDDIAAYTDAANHIADINNPHAVTKSQIGLSNVINAEQLLASQLEQTLTPTASGSVPSSKAVADYISDVSLNMSGTDIVAAINSGSAVINGANISSQMASKTYVDNSISAATSDVVLTSDVRLTNARTPTAHTHSAYDITSFDTRVSNNATIRAAFDALAAMDAIQFDHLQDASVHFTSAERSKLASIEAGATSDMNASQIVSLINNSASIINDARIASTIARDSELTAAIDAHSASPTAHHTNVNDPTTLEKAALAGQGGTPSGTNRFVVNSDPRLTEPRVPLTHASSHIAGGNDIIPSATVNTAGLMSSADKIKLNSIESGASGDLTAFEIVTLINASDSKIDEGNIDTEIARADDVTHLLGVHSNDAVAHHTNINDPTSAQKAALAGIGGTPGAANPYVTHLDSRMTNARTPIAHAASHQIGGSDDLGLGTAAFLDVGEANGVAELDVNGKVPASQLPSYVDDVIVYSQLAGFPTVGETSKVYVAADTNKTYRWTGSSYVEIGTNLALGETSATAYRGDRGAIAYSHAITGGNPHGLMCSDITDFDTSVSENSTVVNLGNAIAALDVIQFDHSQNESVHFTSAERSKLSAIEAGATADLTASEIVTLINASINVINDGNIASTLSRTSHTHGNISAAGAIGVTKNLPVITTTGGVLTTGTFGTNANTFCQGNDARLSDSRAPTSHNNSAHSETYITATGVTYEALSNNSDIGTGSSQVAAGDHAHSGVYEPVFSKNTAFNKDFGTISGSVCAGNDSRLSDARAPTSHTHGNISMSGYIYSTANKPLITGTAGIITTGSFGTDANTFCQGNDSRLSNARTPVSHTHTYSDISSLVTTITDDDTKIPTAGAVVDYVAGFGSGDMLKSTYDTNNNGVVDAAASAPWAGITDKPSVFTPDSHAHGSITNTGYLGSTANVPLITGTSGIIKAGSFGTSANTFCQGNDSRLSDARTPTSHAHGNVTNTGAIGSTANLPVITTTSGVLTVGSFGTGANTFCVGNDSRLSDARTPVSHTHGNITNGGLIGTTANLPIITGTGGILQAGAFGTGATDFAAGNHTHAGYASSTHASTHVTGGSDVIANAISGGNAGLMSGTDKAKLNGIESGATADMTASEILTALLTVDTDTSGLNAQTVKSCAVQTTITNSDSYIPTSGAVTDLFATKLSPFDLRAAGWNVVGKYNGGSSSTTTATANYVMYWPLPIGSKNVTITKLGINITAGATGNFRMGIYSDSGSVAPSALLYDYGERSTAATGLIELSSSNTLSANTLYWVGLTYSATPTISYYTQAYCVSIGVIDATPTTSASCWRESRSYAALPTNVGTIAKHDAACQSFAYFTY